MSRKHRIYKDIQEREKLDVKYHGEFYTRNLKMHTVGPSHLNLCVYVPNVFTETGLVWWLYSLGYQVTVNMMNIYEQCENNPFLVLASNLVSPCGIGGIDINPEEEIDDWISKVKDNDFYKDIINCGSDVGMFSLLAQWNDNDIRTQLLLKNYDTVSGPVSVCNAPRNYKTYEEYPEHLKAIYRPMTIEEVVDYFKILNKKKDGKD